MTSLKLAPVQIASNELLLEEQGVSLCFLLNRRARTLRVIDFRSGASAAKRAAVLDVARREGAERVYTLVERDEVAAWTRMGFLREGNIPGFYKRSDAWVLGTLVQPEVPERPGESGVRLAISSIRSDDEIEAESEQTYTVGRRLMKERVEAPLPAVKLSQISEADVKREVTAAARAGRAISTFEPFGRDVERQAFACTSRGGSVVFSTESQTCFDNALIELLSPPRTDKEAMLIASSLKALTAELESRGTVSAFSLTPTGDSELAYAFLANGFRRTGLLRHHLLIGRKRVDALLWSRKLAQPADG